MRSLKVNFLTEKDLEKGVRTQRQVKVKGKNA